MSQETSVRDRVLAAFSAEFGGEPEVLARAPGRVNLIGEHTDYNDGFVLPIAIDRSVYIAAARQADDAINLVALDYDDRVAFSLHDIAFDPDHAWSNYPRGVAWVLQRHGISLCGLEAAISGDVPTGAGLSSSAAIEIASAKTFQALCPFDMPPTDLALAAQEAENHFVGMQCGIMDQFISTMGRRGHALLIDCRSLERRLVPIPEGCSVLVANTMKKRGLVDSEYNLRRSECEQGVRLLRAHLPNITALRDVTPADMDRYGSHLPDIIAARCRHVVSENARTLEGAEALRRGDAEQFGRLMAASHNSLRDDYEVSSPELDHLVELAQSEPGVYGARMTGAGFGGCTVNLVRSERAEEISRDLQAKYVAWSGVTPEMYVCQAEDGADAKRLHY
jgi:galactokinase